MQFPITRSKLAKILGVTPQRVSQMESAGQLAPPQTPFDDKTPAWPASYVDAVEARRSGRGSSWSLYGLPPMQDPAPHTEDRIFWFEEQAAHAQVFLTDTCPVVVLRMLSSPQPSPWPDTSEGPARNNDFWLDKWLPSIIHEAAEEFFQGDLYRAAWLAIEAESVGLTVSEVVVSRKDGIEYKQGRDKQFLNLQTGRLSFADVAEKLGRKLPIFPSPLNTPAVVEQWNAGRRKSPLQVTCDHNLAERTAEAAVRLHRLSTLDRALRDAACSALAREIRWDDPFPFEPRYFLPRDPKEQDSLEVAAVAEEPDVAGRYHELLAVSAAMEPPVPALQEFVRKASELQYEIYGGFGSAPDPSILAALDMGMTASIQTVRRLSDYQTEAGPRHFHTLRTFEPRNRELWQKYRNSLREVSEADTPAKRELAAKPHWSGELKRRFLVEDPEGIAGVIFEYVRDGEEEEHLTLAVPVVDEFTTDRSAADFEAILVEPHTVDGPIFLQTSIGYRVMPFASSHPRGFTHGYNGSGPSSLALEIQKFVEWATGNYFTKVGSDRLFSAIWGTDQGSRFVVNRHFFDQPGTLRDTEGSWNE